MKELTVCWISAGVSSFVAGWLARGHVDSYIYLDISDQHPDSLRFIRDCEAALDKPIEILRSRQYGSVSDVCRGVRFVRRMTYAPCTDYLKKRVRKEWEYAHTDCDITYVWGMDLNEKARAERIEAAMPDFRHEFPLIERGLTKQDAHGILHRLGIRRPAMYDLGYSNNNCVGCLKGGARLLEQNPRGLPGSIRRPRGDGARNRPFHYTELFLGRTSARFRANAAGNHGRVRNLLRNGYALEQVERQKER